MRKVFTLGTLILILAGCTAVRPSTRWTPDNENHMRQLIGETVMQALQEHCAIHNSARQLLQPLNERL